MIIGDIVVWLVVDEAHVSTIAVSPLSESRASLTVAGKSIADLQGKRRRPVDAGGAQEHLAAQRLYQKLGFIVWVNGKGITRTSKKMRVLRTLPVLDEKNLPIWRMPDKIITILAGMNGGLS